MPTTIYLRTGDELTVAEPYDQVIAHWQSDARAEFTALWWTDPDSPGFDSLSEWPTYRESRVMIDLSAAVVVEEEDLATIAAIERGRRHLLERD